MIQSSNDANNHLLSVESPIHNSHLPSTDLTVVTQRTTSKTIKFKDLEELFNELIQSAMAQGRDPTRTLYGAGI